MMVTGEWAVVVYTDRHLPGPGAKIARHVMGIYAGAPDQISAENWAKGSVARGVPWEVLPVMSIADAVPMKEVK